MELWDLYDENRRLLDRTHRRGEQMKTGEFHVVVEVWTINAEGEILVTLRDPNKRDYPNKWENTGGSVLSGESSRRGAVRELHEETGIVASENELIFLGTSKDRSAFVDIYFLKRDVKIEDIILQDGETVDAKFISLDTLESMIKDLSLALPPRKRLQHVRNEFDKHYCAKL